MTYYNSKCNKQCPPPVYPIIPPSTPQLNIYTVPARQTTTAFGTYGFGNSDGRIFQVDLSTVTPSVTNIINVYAVGVDGQVNPYLAPSPTNTPPVDVPAGTDMLFLGKSSGSTPEQSALFHYFYDSANKLLYINIPYYGSYLPISTNAFQDNKYIQVNRNQPPYPSTPASNAPNYANKPPAPITNPYPGPSGPATIYPTNLYYKKDSALLSSEGGQTATTNYPFRIYYF